MKRRTFLSFLGLAPAAPVAAMLPAPVAAPVLEDLIYHLEPMEMWVPPRHEWIMDTLEIPPEWNAERERQVKSRLREIRADMEAQLRGNQE